VGPMPKPAAAISRAEHTRVQVADAHRLGKRAKAKALSKMDTWRSGAMSYASITCHHSAAASSEITLGGQTRSPGSQRVELGG